MSYSAPNIDADGNILSDETPVLLFNSHIFNQHKVAFDAPAAEHIGFRWGFNFTNAPQDKTGLYFHGVLPKALMEQFRQDKWQSKLHRYA